MKEEPGAARSTASGPISSSRPVRRRGMSRSNRSLSFSFAKAWAFMSVTNQPGAIALTWMLWRGSPPPPPQHRGDIDDLPALGRQEGGGRGPAAVQDARQVGLEHPTPFLRRPLREGSHVRHAGIVDENIQATQAGHGPPHQRLDIRAHTPAG